MNRKKIMLFIFIVFFNLSNSSIFAYDNVTTHRRITEKSIPFSNLDLYLKKNLGFANGYKEIISGQEILTLISYGSYLEDGMG